MSAIITVENLGKKYTLRHQRREEYTALRDVLAESVKGVGRRVAGMFSSSPFTLHPSPSSEDFWALKDVSFEVNQGDRIGIIGRNGAGKSTLLKILSRITEPTTGRVKIKGRVASLLEVGTGFHPELTGRENIYLNGAILGMSRVEIKKKFDEIVAFAEIEKFLDTPVKRYSSGMYVRLAFAVAAHLEPEILIVDEVLAVGDAQFQKKCLGKMEDVSKEGRTVIFVSHNMDAIERLCDRVVLLKSGQVASDSDAVDRVIVEYLLGSECLISKPLWEKENSINSNKYFDLLAVKLYDFENKLASSVISNDFEVSLIIEANISVLDKSLNIGYVMYAENRKTVYWSCFTDASEEYWPQLKVGKNILISKIPYRLLNEGIYTIEVMASLHNHLWLVEPGKFSNYISFRILGGLSDSPFWFSRRPGTIAPVIAWENYRESDLEC